MGMRQMYSNNDADLRRRLDEVKQAQGAVYGQREIVSYLIERLDRIQRQCLSGGA